jgi:acyl transferase domain-containing protein/phosphopantetheinyl transferase
MACLFPKAPDVATYWENIVSKVDAIGDPPDSRDMEPFLRAKEETGLYCVRGGYIGDLARFRPQQFGVMPHAVDGAEPDQFLALEIAHQTLRDAGVPKVALNRERTEVILGRGTFVNRGTLTQFQHKIAVDQFLDLLRELHPEHDEEEIEAIRERLKAALPPITAEVAGGMAPSLVSGRIANRFDLKGPNCTIDAACASSLIAIERGMQDLLAGRCDAVLAGGVQVSTPAPIHNMFADMGALSRSRHPRPFDQDADGTMLGEGAGMILLKRLEDAERDGNRVYALLRAVGSSSDGRAKAVLTPRVEGEELALRRAYSEAGIAPDTVGLIEAHGTAMPVGDQTEIEALRGVFGDRRGAPTIALGSVKSMISHLLPAAGIAGIIKAALALHHKILPPTLHCEKPNPKLEIEKTPFYLNTESRPWIHGADAPRRAGVNAFGFGGINAHAILEEHRGVDESEATSFLRSWDTELLILSANDREGILARARTVRRVLEQSPQTPLRDLAWSVNADPGKGALRLAVVASDADDLARKLDHAVSRLQDPACRRIKDRKGLYFFAEPLHPEGKIAFLFPGEGSQYPGMLTDLCLHFPTVRSRFDLMDRAFLDHPRGYRPSEFIFPPPAPGQEADPEEAERRLWQMDGAVESVFVASQALAALLRELGLRPDAVAGHSAGEYSALLAAGATRVENDKQLIRMILDLNDVYQRLAGTEGVPKVSLVTVGGADPALVDEVIRESEGALYLAVDNCRYQVVLCGLSGPMGDAVGRLRAEGAICGTLPFDRPYHTPLFEPAYALLGECFPQVDPPPPGITLWSCATAAPYPDDPGEAGRVALEQWIRPVRFRETIEAMYAAGVRIFVEVGPRGNLTAFANDILGKRPALAVPSNVISRSGIAQLHHLLGLLAAQGVSLDLTPLYQRREARRIDLSAPAPAAPPREDGMPISLALPRLRLAPAAAPPRQARPAPSRQNGRERSPAQIGTAGPEGLEPEFQSYFKTMERFLEIQTEVMEAYLAPDGAASGAVPDGALLPAPEQALAEPGADVSTAAGAPATEGRPLIGTLLDLSPGESLSARRRLDPQIDRFLLDHKFGGSVSVSDPSLIPLPLMPLTMTMEMAAEAASVLLPDLRVIGLRDVRANRWITLGGGPVTLEIAARCEGADAVFVEIREAAGEKRPAAPILEARVCFGEAYPSAPAPESFPLSDERPSRWTPDRIYREGMFHGPRFQGVDCVERWGTDGAIARLRNLPEDALFATEDRSPLLIAPILLDAAGQVVGFWNAEHDVLGFSVFPFRVDAVEIYAPPLPPVAAAECRARIREVGERHLRSDLDILGPDGRLHVRIRGWEDRGFQLPEPLCRLTSESQGLTLSEPWEMPIAHLPGREGYRCRRVRELPGAPPEGRGLLWEIAAHLILSRTERETWAGLKRPLRARIEWLMGRAAVKDSVIDLLRTRHGLSLLPADVEISADPLGRPLVGGAWTGQLESPLSVTLAHSRGVAVGLAADGGLGIEAGIDLEHLRSLADGFDGVAFTEEETRILDSAAPPDLAEWRLRAWCAKESAAKALGTGLGGRPRNFSVRKIDLASGRVAIEANGEAGRLKPGEAGETLEAFTLREGDLVAAVTTWTRRAT